MANAERMIERYAHGLALSTSQDTVLCKMLLIKSNGSRTYEVWNDVLGTQDAISDVKLDKSREL